MSTQEDLVARLRDYGWADNDPIATIERAALEDAIVRLERLERLAQVAKRYREGGHDTCATGCKTRIELDAALAAVNAK